MTNVTKTEPDDYLVIGVVGAPFSVQGWVHIRSFTEQPSAILRYQPWYLHQGGSWQACEIVEHRCQSNKIMVRFADCHDRCQAQNYTQAQIGISKHQLPPLAKDEYYWHDLEGLIVQTVNGINLGKLDHLFTTGANDVMVIIGAKRHLVPFLQDTVIKQIDLQNNTMIVDWDADF